MYAYWLCDTRKTPIFSPKFPLRGISFSQMIKIFRSGDHHFRNVQAGSPNAKRSGSAPGLAAGQSARQTDPTVSSGDPMHLNARGLSGSPQFHARRRYGAPHFHARARSGATHFSLCRGTYTYQNFGAGAPPPPGFSPWVTPPPSVATPLHSIFKTIYFSNMINRNASPDC